MRVGIVGAGIAGLSSAWALTKAGHQITLFEQDMIPNPHAASGDQHRLIRRAYGSRDGYARTISDAFAAWEEIWHDLGKRHYAETGIVSVCQFEGDEGDAYTKGYERTGTRHERLNARETEERFPFLDATTLSYASFAPEGGVLFSKRIADDLRDFLAAAGVELRPHTRVTAIDTATATLFVTSQNSKPEPLVFDRLIVTAGAWLADLMPDLGQIVTAYRTAAVYLAPPPEFESAWAEAPGFISVGGTRVDGYILPPVGGTGLKFGAGIHKIKAQADAFSAVIPGEGEAIRDHFSPPFHDMGRYQVTEVRPCVYTFTRDQHFFGVERDKAWIVSACSGHGYKFGAAVGKRLATAIDTGDGAGFIRWLEARD